MKKELHHVNKTYGNHQLARYIDVYEVSANRCHSVPESGYKGTEATLVDDPAWNEKFSSYSITGATLTGNNFILNNDVTAQANYETAKNLTLQTDGHGTIAANKNSGFIGDQVTLSNTPDTRYSLSGYTITGAILTGNKFNFIGNDVTAKAWFSAEPSYTSKAVNGYYMSTGNGVSGSQYGSKAWVSETNPGSYLVVTLPYSTTSRTYNYKPFASDRFYTTLTSNRNYVSNYRTLVIDEYNWATGGSLNASAVVTSIGVNCEMWWSLPSTATQSCTFNMYASVNNQLIASGGPWTIAPGQTLFTEGWSPVKIPLTNNIIIDKNNSIPIKFYKDSTATAVSAGLSATRVTWNGYISALV